VIITLLVLAVLLSIAVGTRTIPLGTVLDAVFHFDPANADHLVVHDLRLPRTAVGLLAGAALGMAGATPVKLALAGAAVSAALMSITSAVLLTDTTTFDEFRFWQVGSLTGRDPSTIAQAVPFLAVGTVLALVCGRMLNALSLGEDVARALGQNVVVTRLLCALSVIILCGSATAIAGPIGFVGLTVPHVARMLTGPDYRWLIPFSALLAPLLLLVSDVVGRVILAPAEVGVGIITAVIGAPVFIALVRRRKPAEL
jgi:iron complex transport system permease protein